MNQRAYKRFTLIELLVVVAIIAILAALLIPGLARAKKKTRNVICVNNLKQKHIALVIYADDFDAYYPNRGTGRYNEWSYKLNGVQTYDMHDTIEQYIPPGNVYSCPFDPDDWTTYWDKEWNNGITSHGWYSTDVYAGQYHPVTTYYEPDGTSHSQDDRQNVINFRIGDHPNRPILGDPLIRDTSNKFLRAFHATGEPFKRVNDLSLLEHNYVFDDGSSKVFYGDDELKKLSQLNTSNWSVWWHTREE